MVLESTLPPETPERLQRLPEVVGEGRFELHPTLLTRVLEPQAPGVQRLPQQQRAVFVRRGLRDEIAQMDSIAAAVHLVGQDRTAGAGQVNADLVRASRARLDAAEREASK